MVSAMPPDGALGPACEFEEVIEAMEDSVGND
jgi:hypothetical protein